MTYKVVLTDGWTFEQLAGYTRDITAAMHKLADKFTDDMTVYSLFQEIASGRQKMWLILDDQDAFVAFAMTRTETIEATGKKIVTLTNMAGGEGLKIAPAMCEAIHAWARDTEGADQTRFIGTRAWLKALKAEGYREYAIIGIRDIAQ